MAFADFIPQNGDADGLAKGIAGVEGEGGEGNGRIIYPCRSAAICRLHIYRNDFAAGVGEGDGEYGRFRTGIPLCNGDVSHRNGGNRVIVGDGSGDVAIDCCSADVVEPCAASPVYVTSAAVRFVSKPLLVRDRTRIRHFVRREP